MVEIIYDSAFAPGMYALYSDGLGWLGAYATREEADRAAGARQGVTYNADIAEVNKLLDYFAPAPLPPLPAPAPLPTGTTGAAPTTGAGETGTGRLPTCMNDIDGLVGWYAHTCQGRPVFTPEAPAPSTTGKTFWDVFSFEDSKSKIGIVIIAAIAFIFLSKR